MTKTLTVSTSAKTTPQLSRSGKSALAVSGALSLLLVIFLLAPDSAQAIVRVKVAPEVGRHVFQLDLGGTGAIEDFAGDAGFAWSAGWAYHADNTLGLGVTVGRNLSESNIPITADKDADFSYKYATATVQVRAPTRSSFIPHLQAGFGLYSLNIEERKISNTTAIIPLARVDDTRFGMFFGAGLDYLVNSHVSLGVIGNYHYISVNQNIPQTQGLGDWYNTWDVKGVLTFYTH